MKITAAVARAADQPFSIETVELDEPREDEVRVRIVGVGLCHTDLVMKSGRMTPLPSVLGHEGSGIIEAVGDKVTKVAVGDRVAISFMSCGQCRRCEQGDPAYCEIMPKLNFSGRRPDGSPAITSGEDVLSSNFFGQSSFATHCLAFERNVVKIPDDIPLELVGPLGCGIQTGAGAIMRSLACEPGSTLLVIGGGAVGLSAVMAAKVQQCSRIIVMEPHAARRDMALELGATDVIDPTVATDLPAAVRGLLPRGVDYVFDTAGIPALLSSAMNCLAPKGVLGVVGIAPPGTPLPGELMPAVALGLTVKGIIEGDSDPDSFIPEMIALRQQGRFPFDKLITTYPFAEINQAIADQHHGKCIKVVLLMD